MAVTEKTLVDTMRDISMEIRVQGLSQHVRSFSGESSNKFHDWVRDMDSIACSTDDKRMLVLATRTLSGPAGKFACRLLAANQNLKWPELRKQLRDRYSDLKDPYCAKEKLQKVRQKKGELIQNFSERLQDIASEIFDNPNSPDSQRTLVEVFQKGVNDDRLARALIRKKFTSLQEAVKFASDEQQTDRTFELCRGRLDVDEPMEVDVVRNDSQTDRIEKLEKCLSDVGLKIDKLAKAVSKNQGSAYSSPLQKQSQPQTRRPYQAPPRNQRHFQAPPQNNRQFQRQYQPTQWQRRPQNQPQQTHFQSQQTAPANAGPNEPPPRYKWTPDGRPICAYCQKVGHTQRVCRAKQTTFSGPPQSEN